MTNNPFFSIVIPMYNDEKYIRDCLDSIFSQSFSDFEVIAVDDGSKDSSPEICREYAEKHSNLTLVCQKNGGCSAARNTGMSKARGKYIFFVDSDDFIIGSNALQTIYSSLSETEPDFLVCLSKEFDESLQKVKKSYPKGSLIENHLYKTSEVCNQIYRENGIWVTQAYTKIVRLDFIRKNKMTFAEGLYHEDDKWIAELFLNCDTVCFIYEALYGRRSRPGSITTSMSQEKIYKRISDKVKIGSMMVTLPEAKKYKEYLRYASDYFLNNILRTDELDEEHRKKLINYLIPFRSTCRYIISIKAPKQSLKAMFILVFGIRNYLRLYKRKING